MRCMILDIVSVSFLFNVVILRWQPALNVFITGLRSAIIRDLVPTIQESETAIDYQNGVS
jgi:hypothetical protein